DDQVGLGVGQHPVHAERLRLRVVRQPAGVKGLGLFGRLVILVALVAGELVHHPFSVRRGSIAPGVPLPVSVVSLLHARLIVSRPITIFRVIDGCQPRRSSQIHRKAKNGASTKMARALMDWNHSAGTGLIHSLQENGFSPAGRGLSWNMVAKRWKSPGRAS